MLLLRLKWLNWSNSLIGLILGNRYFYFGFLWNNRFLFGFLCFLFVLQSFALEPPLSLLQHLVLPESLLVLLHYLRLG